LQLILSSTNYTATMPLLILNDLGKSIATLFSNTEKLEAGGSFMGDIKPGDEIFITTSSLGEKYKGMRGTINNRKLVNDKYSIKLSNGMDMAFSADEFRHNSVNPRYAKGGTIETDTPIIPSIIAENIASAKYFAKNSVPKENEPELIKKAVETIAKLEKHLEEKANTLYKNNEFFKKQINQSGNKGRDTLYMFMEHWADSFLGKKYAKGGELANKRIVDYAQAIVEFNEKLLNNEGVVKVATRYGKTTEEVVKKIQPYLSVLRYKDKSIKEVKIDLDVTGSGIVIKEKTKYADGGEVDNISYAKTKGKESQDFKADAIEYVGGINEWNKLTEEEKRQIINEEEDSWSRQFNFAKGGGVKQYKDLSLIEPSFVNDSKFEEGGAMIKLKEVDLIRKGFVEISSKDAIVRNSQTAVDIFRDYWSDNSINIQESFNVLFLNKQNKAIGIYNLSKSGIDATVADAELVAAMAIKTLAKGVVICHNHPSGNLNPSQADIALSKRVKEGLKLFGIELLDSLIITEKSYYSLADEGNLEKGGGVNTGRSWHLDRARHNKNEAWEKPLNKRKMADGGELESEDERIKSMVNGWNKEGRAFSSLSYDDAAFFEATGLDFEKVGITSQTGNDILYYDTNIYDSGRDAIYRKRKEKFLGGGELLSDSKLKSMVEGWKEDGRAFSNLNYNDTAFFEAIGVDFEKVGITSQTGNDIVYYDCNIYDNDDDALRKKRKEKMAKGGAVNGRYLDKIADSKKNKILNNIANHYAISIEEAEQEVRDADAEMLYKYIANDQSLRMDIYKELEIRHGEEYEDGGQMGKSILDSEFWKDIAHLWTSEHIDFKNGSWVNTGRFKEGVVNNTSNKYWTNDRANLIAELANSYNVNLNDVKENNPSFTAFDFYKNRLEAKRGEVYEHGGDVADVLKVTDGDDTWYLTYCDSTHFFLSNSPDFKGNAYHIGQFRKRPFYNEVNLWLKSHNRSYMADGGLLNDSESIILNSPCIGDAEDKNEYRWVLKVRQPAEKSGLYVERNFQGKGKWDGVPSGWYIGTLLDLPGYFGNSKGGDTIAIDFGQKWYVHGLRNALQEALGILEIKANGEATDGVLKVGDVFTGEANGKYEHDYELYNPKTSYVLDSQNKVVSVHASPVEALRHRSKLYETKPDNYKVHYDSAKMANGGLLQNYRNKLESMSDDELADEWVYETGVDKSEVMADIEDERDTYIDDLVRLFTQSMRSRGEKMADGGEFVKHLRMPWPGSNYMQKGGELNAGDDVYVFTAKEGGVETKKGKLVSISDTGLTARVMVDGKESGYLINNVSKEPREFKYLNMELGKMADGGQFVDQYRMPSAGSNYMEKGGGVENGGVVNEPHKVYKLAEEMTDAEYTEKLSQCSKEQKSTVESLIRLGDTPKLALATVLWGGFEKDVNSDTWKLYTMENGGRMAAGNYYEFSKWSKQDECDEFERRIYKEQLKSRPDEKRLEMLRGFHADCKTS
jgi:DNA repair protein RadC